MEVNITNLLKKQLKMKYVICVENVGKPRLVNSKADLNRVVANIEEGPGIICIAWNKNTPGSVMAQTSENILGKEQSMLIGFSYLVDDSTPLHEMLWEAFEKVLS